MIQFFETIIYYPFINLLNFFIWLVPGHYAATGIILLTLAVRLVLILPSKRAAEGQRRLAELQPLIDQLKEEYGDDKQGLALAQMELYKKNNINPFGSCLPLLIQFPILIILYRAILNGLTPNNPHLYSWLPKVTSINENFFGINLSQPDHYYILPVLAAVFQYFLTVLTLPPKPKTILAAQDPAQAMQRQMVYIIPVMILLFAIRFPAGVSVYYIVTTVFSIVQQYKVNQQRLKLVGVSEVITEVEKSHPRDKVQLEKTKEEYQQLESSTNAKKGVTITVRRKK